MVYEKEEKGGMDREAENQAWGCENIIIVDVKEQTEIREEGTVSE